MTDDNRVVLPKPEAGMFLKLENMAETPLTIEMSAQETISLTKPPSPFLTFDEWLVEQKELADNILLNEETACEECNGSGRVDFDDEHDPRFRSHMRRLYEEAKATDQIRLIEWNKIIKEEAS